MQSVPLLNFFGTPEECAFVFLLQQGQPMHQEHILSERIMIEELFATIAVTTFAVKLVIPCSLCVFLIYGGREVPEPLDERG
jgi:hypothetical protein